MRIIASELTLATEDENDTLTDVIRQSLSLSIAIQSVSTVILNNRVVKCKDPEYVGRKTIPGKLVRERK